MEQKPGDLIVQQKHRTNFRRASVSRGRTRWSRGLVYNLVDGAAKLGLSMSELGAEYDKLKKCETMLRFGGGFFSSSSSMASTRACASSSPSLARPFTKTWSSGTRINSNGRTSAERSWEAPTQRPLAPRPFATPCSRVGRGWASLPNQDWEQRGARLRQAV